jgi:hypothetical protein
MTTEQLIEEKEQLIKKLQEEMEILKSGQKLETREHILLRRDHMCSVFFSNTSDEKFIKLSNKKRIEANKLLKNFDKTYNVYPYEIDNRYNGMMKNNFNIFDEGLYEVKEINYPQINL